MDSIVERIGIILQAKDLNHSKFADEIGVQRSSISHIMTGRNKPSLDVVLKILDTYKDINADWLIQGKGKMIFSSTLFDIASATTEEEELPIETKPIQEDREKKKVVGDDDQGAHRGKKIMKVLILYEDQTFKEFVEGQG